MRRIIGQHNQKIKIAVGAVFPARCRAEKIYFLRRKKSHEPFHRLFGLGLRFIPSHYVSASRRSAAIRKMPPEIL